jgi:hypothetical protein
MEFKKFVLLSFLLWNIQAFCQIQTEKHIEKSSVEDERPLNISLIQLIANPEKYDGRKVVVKGFLTLKFESTLLYLDKENRENGLHKNSIWINIQSDPNSIYHEKYVTVVGTFDMKFNGHFGCCSGSIKNVLEIY